MVIKSVFKMKWCVLILMGFVHVGVCHQNCRGEEPRIRNCDKVCDENNMCKIRAALLLPKNTTYDASLSAVGPVLDLAMQAPIIKDAFPSWLTVEWMKYDVTDCDAAYAVISAIDAYNDCAHVFFGPACDFALAGHHILYEIRMALKQLKNNKAAGEDGITAELLKAGGTPVLKVLQKLFNSVLHEGITPEAWNSGVVVLFFTKGDNTLLKNYRPISLLSPIYKLFSRVIMNRLANRLDDFQPPEQAGFRKGYSTIDHIHTLRQNYSSSSGHD